MNLPAEPILRTVGRRIYTRSDDPSHAMLVYLLEDGKLLNVVTLEEWEPSEIWHHSESFPENATYVLMLKWADRWGEECIALFGSATDADDFTRRLGIGTHVRQRVRLIL